MNRHPVDALSDYLDDHLEGGARTAIDTHLAGCADCRAVVADLITVRATASARREAVAAPTTDLWPGIAARLAGPREMAAPIALGAPSAAPAPPVVWYRRRWSVGLPELAVAATLLAAVGGASLWPRATPPAPAAATPVPIIAESDAFDIGDERVTPVDFADAQYDAAIGDLERVLQEQREWLDPRTVIVLERNLRVIDDAIGEARQALATDPANALLNAHLAGARQRKLDLLRRAARITEGD
ncbi:MAG: zf-HC2 domain-containing protein [Acidobacteria bacterium]|nr:zf-HC2 domain-containing protein [Acidobacteriota bacterium]